MRTMLLLAIFLAAYEINQACASNILIVSTLASHSHHIWAKSLAIGLIERGHTVTLVTHDEEKEKIDNLEVIVFEGLYTLLSAHFSMVAMKDVGSIKEIRSTYDHLEITCREDFRTEGFKTLMSKTGKTHYDLIMWDINLSQCLYPIIQLFGTPPVIGITAYGLPPQLSEITGHHLHSSYVPSSTLPYSDHMSFAERIHNYFINMLHLLYRRYINAPAERKTSEQYFGKDIPSIEEFEKNITLVLSNIDHSFDYPRSLPPNVIPVGGLQIKPAGILQPNFKNIADKSEHGFIVFALGSNVQSSQLGEERINVFLNAFRQIKQNVIWKFENDSLVNVPPNVFINKWLPQNDLLGHPNTKLLIYHGGGLSTQETKYHGVPVLCIPFVLDQRMHCSTMQTRKLGKHVELDDITTDGLVSLINEVINNPIYKNNIVEMSERYRSQPLTALQRAVLWTEYAIRHKGAHHLRTAAKSMPFYQIWLLDIAAVIAFTVYIFVKIFWLLCQKFEKNKEKTE